MKYCNKCNKNYPATTEYFYTDNNKKDKLGIYCKTCTSKYHVKYHKKKKKERKKFEKIYRGPILDMSKALNLKIISEKQYKLGQTTADFVNCIAWGKLAEIIANYTAKGRLLAVQGRITTGSYEDKDGKRVYTTEVTANNISILEWGDKQEQTIDPQLHPASNDDLPF